MIYVRPYVEVPVRSLKQGRWQGFGRAKSATTHEYWKDFCALLELPRNSISGADRFDAYSRGRARPMRFEKM